MILNLVLLVIGAAFLIYGIRKKIRFWMIAGVVILCLGAVSAYMDYTSASAGGVENSRVPFLIDSFFR